ncbi:MAG: 50S ribosomal protein L11 methyltransferase [Pseudomonadales bacterium]|nr:50S ribosomal protein L11 methyltransferase [Pseudomonadales bacterium]
MWQQIQIQTSSEETASLEELLLEHGAVSISLVDSEDQPIFQKEPGATPLWKHVTLLALFEADTELKPLLALLSFQPNVLNRDSLNVEVIEDQVWERSWMNDFEAMQFGEKLWICPSWQIPPDPDAVNIMLDPGLAFGSGTHATTSLCLRWLDSQELTGKEVIDYGSGSGVLAIAAALLGAKRVHAVDNDAQAIAATMDNSNRNQIGNRLITAYLPEALPNLKADILLANILAEPLLELADRFAGLVKPGGSLVLSGILEQQSDALVESYGRWFELEPAVLENDWVRLIGKRKS